MKRFARPNTTPTREAEKKCLNQLDEKVMNAKRFVAVFCSCRNSFGGFAAVILSNLFIKILNTSNPCWLVKLLLGGCCMLY